MTLENLINSLNESASSVSALGPDAELLILLEDEEGNEIERYGVDRLIATSRGNLALVIDV